MTDGSAPLVFVFLGNQLPEYTRAALKFAAKGHDGSVVLLTDTSSQLSSSIWFEVVDIRDWYQREHFEVFSGNSLINSAEFGGLWFHAIERFFVLNQYMKHFGLEAVFHAELDVMVFNLRGIEAECDATAKGLFAVMDSPDRVLASLFYVNDLAVFDDFLAFVSRSTSARNEMEILKEYFQQFPNRTRSFPNSRFFENRSEPSTDIELSDRFGLFDGSVFGQWLFGVDPLHKRFGTKNHFRNKVVNFPIEAIRFRFSATRRKLYVHGPNNVSRELRSVHVHSKIVRRLVNWPVLVLYLWLNRLPFSLTVARPQGWIYRYLVAAILGPKGFPVVRKLSKGLRILEPAVSWLIQRSGWPLSIRQQSKLDELRR